MASKTAAFVVMAGESGVGKTLTVERIKEGGPGLENHLTQATVGPDFALIQFSFGTGHEYRVCFIDVPGSMSGLNLVPAYLRRCNGVIAMYDVNVPRTFEALRTEWLPKIEASLLTEVPLLVLANKIDLWSESDEALRRRLDRDRRLLEQRHAAWTHLRLHGVVASSAREWRFLEQAAPVDRFVQETLVQCAKLAHDTESVKRIQLLQRDCDLSAGDGTKGASSSSSSSCCRD